LAENDHPQSYQPGDRFKITPDSDTLVVLRLTGTNKYEFWEVSVWATLEYEGDEALTPMGKMRLYWWVLKDIHTNVENGIPIYLTPEQEAFIQSMKI